MPIIKIQSLPQHTTFNKEKILKRLCCETAKAFDIKPQSVWATWQELEPGTYCEGDRVALEQIHGTHPPIVELVSFKGKRPENIEKALLTVAEVIGQELDLNDNVFVHYNEIQPGHVYTGGQIRK